MQHMISKSEIVYGIRRLNVTERLNIISDVWDEIKDSRELETISEDDRRILLSRLANYRAAPDSATDWAELRQEMYDRYAQKS